MVNEVYIDTAGYIEVSKCDYSTHGSFPVSMVNEVYIDTALYIEVSKEIKAKVHRVSTRLIL